jgi:hypothetical protein
MPVKNAAKKRTPVKTVQKKKRLKKPKLACVICGMEITIDKACECEESHPIMCCGHAMKKK